MRPNVLAAVLCAGLLVSGGCGGGGSSGPGPLPEVTHIGVISVDETWDAQHRHRVIGDVYVEAAGGVTLTIEAGAKVVFDQGYFLHIGWNDPGALRAEGTAGKRISFSASSPSPTKGFWGGIWFHDLAYDYDSNPLIGCVMDYCDVRWGGAASGWGSGSGCILVEGSVSGPSIRISNCRVSDSAEFGIILGYGGMFAAGSSGNRISGCDYYPVGIEAEEAGTLEAGTYTGNAIDEIEVDSFFDGVETTATWINPGVPYHLFWNMEVAGATSPVLTIESGATVRFGSQTILYVGWNDAGGLVADNVTFTADTPAPTKGYWVGIILEDFLTNGTLTNCTVEYGGYDSGYMGYSGDLNGDDDGNIVIIDNGRSNTTITNCTIQHSLGYGIVKGWAGTPTPPDFSSNTFIDCDLGDQSLPR